MKFSYTDMVAPLQPEGTVAAFCVKEVDSIRVLDPTTAGEKLRSKIKASKVTLQVICGEQKPFSLIDTIPLKQGWIDKLDGLRVATGEEIATRENFDTDTLVDKMGFLVLTVNNGRNFIARYLRPAEGQDEFDKQP